MRYLSSLFLVSFLFLGIQSDVFANLCKSVRDNAVETSTQREVDYYEQLFSDSDYHGYKKYNEVILECNRKRDKHGTKVNNYLSDINNNDSKALLEKERLDKKIIRGLYSFYGKSLYTYRYMLSKKDYKWTAIIPYKATINDIVKNRIDFMKGYKAVKDVTTGELHNIQKKGPAWDMYELSQVIVKPNNRRHRYTLIKGAEPIAETLCKGSEYFSGKENEYQNKEGYYSYKRDRANKHINLGEIQYRYFNPLKPKKRLEQSVRIGCRVDKNTELYWMDPDSPTFRRVKSLKKIIPHEWIFDNFIRVAEKYWSQPDNFTLKIVIKNYDKNNDEDKNDAVNLFKNSDYIPVKFATTFLPHNGNQMYKSNILQFNNFSTMTTDGTYFHEVGHALGLDDEYANTKGHDIVTDADGNVVVEGNNRDCQHEQFKQNPHVSGTPKPYQYMMCEGYKMTPVTTIYHYLAVSRYSANQSESPSCNAGWTYQIRNPLNKDRCSLKGIASAGLLCKLLVTDKKSNWTGPHARQGKDFCKSTKGKKNKSVKCPVGYRHTIRTGGDTCTKSKTRYSQPVCPQGFNYKSQKGKDICLKN